MINDKSKVIERCCSVQAIKNFFFQLFNLKKACYFSFAILQCCKGKKKAFTEADKIDIDAPKLKKKSKTNEAENRQKIKNSQSQLKIYRFQKRRVHFDLLTFDNF